MEALEAKRKELAARIPTTFLYVGYPLSLTYAVFFWLGMNLSSPGCLILACQYSASLIPIVNALGVVLFLPLVAYIILLGQIGAAPNPTIAVFLVFASIIYFLFLCYGIAIGIDKIRGKSTRGMLSDKQTMVLLGNFGALSVITFDYLLTGLTFLAYPLVQLSIDYLNFVEVASLLVLVITLYSIKEVGLTSNKEAYKALLGVALATLVVLIIGAFFSFTSNVRFVSQPETTVDLASTEAFEVGGMGGGLTGLLFTFVLAVSGLRKNTEDSHQPGGNNDEQNIPATSATMAVNPRQATSPTPSSKTSKPSLRRRQPARVLIGILSISLLVVGIATVPSDSELGYTFVAWGGGTFLTYLVVDVLLLREDRGNWKVVKDKAVSVINSELEGIRIDTLLFSGSEDLVITIPDGLSEEQETRFFAEEHLNEARRLSNNLEALKGRGLPNILNVKGLFDSRADKLASFQNRYWSRLLEPDLMAYLVDLEARLRRVDTSLEVLRKYQGFPEPTDELRGIREWEISSSWETLYRDMQSLLSCVLNGVDRGIIPKG